MRTKGTPTKPASGPRRPACSRIAQFLWIFLSLTATPPGWSPAASSTTRQRWVSSSAVQICQKSRWIGCVIPHCNLQCGITQHIPPLFWDICRERMRFCCNINKTEEKNEGKVAWFCNESNNAGSRNLSFNFFDISVLYANHKKNNAIATRMTAFYLQ